MSMEFKVIKLGSSSAKNEELLNKLAGEGWSLVSTSPVSRLSNQSGMMVTDIQAFLTRKKSKENVING